MDTVSTAYITIHWARHAESCANFDGETYQDKNMVRPLGYDEYISINNVPESIIDNKINVDWFSKLKAKFMYHPNLSFIGMQHAILLGTEFAKPQIEQKKYNAVFVSATVRAITTAMMAFRGTDVIINVVPYINEVPNISAMIGMDYQNTPYKSEILKKQIYFMKDWLEHNWITKFDDIEVMQKLIYLRDNLPDDSNLTDGINAILECKTKAGSIAYGSFDTGKYNECFNKNIVQQLNNIRAVLKSFPIKNTDRNIKGEPINVSKINATIDYLFNMLNKSFIRGPAVDFSILCHFEKEAEAKENNNNDYFIHQDLRVPDMMKFYNIVMPYAFKTMKLPSECKLFCVSHGSLLKNFFPAYYIDRSKTGRGKADNLKNMYNTHVIEERFSIDSNTGQVTEKILVTYDKYNPVPIRTKYENFERLNGDICRLESVKGIINYTLLGKELPVSTIADDVKFVFEPIYDNHEAENAEFVTSDNAEFVFTGESASGTSYNMYGGSVPNNMYGGHDNDKYKIHKYKSKYKRQLKLLKSHRV